MRRSAAWVLVAAVWVSSAWGMGGDMGVGTEPLTDGSEAYPWLIEDFDDFGVFTNTANAAIYWAAGVHTRLMSNLDLDPALPGRQTYVTALIAPNGYEYAGSFDGDGHVISNLTLDDGDIGSSYMALFGRLTPGSEIHHLGLENLYSSGDGGLFYYSGTWIPPVGGGGCTISNCFVTGHVYFGGLFGMICYSSDIINCYAIGTVDSASGTYTGGLVGHFHEGNLINTYSAVDGHGMAGSNFYGRVINCYFDRDLAGSETSAGGWGKTTAQMKNAATFMGWKDGSWIINEGNDYPRLSWQGGGTPIATDYPARTYPGDGEAMPFELDSPEDIECLMYRTPDWDKRFILTADIDMAGVSHYRSIPKFAGEFDGGGHVISNLSIQASETGCNTDLGMFGLIYDGGVVKNLGLENCEINGVWYCGAMAGVNHGGTISNCFAAGTVSEGGSFIGGLIGSNNGHVSKSYANVNILGSLIAIHPDRFGGFVGENWYGEIYDCYALGDVDNIAQESGGFVGYNAYGTIQRCYSVGQGNRGFCYSSYSGSISDCFWDMDTSGSSSSTGGTGLTTAEMQSLTPYMGAGWNFEGTWVLFEGYNRYPELAWQLPGEMVAPYGVDVLDLATFSENWLTASAYGDWSPPGEDGFVDMRDFAEFAKNWLYTKPPVYQLYSGGAGTTEDPYLISDVHQLNKIGRITNHWSKHFRLIADIDMLTYTGTRYNIIGNSSTKFTGSFDGDGHVIYNLTHINWL
ncbi:MAG: hypothetical protein JW709_01300, partial [Sedimentisphaerales bacterium]|nr:hypothetical protein [Sedimentisphaerales bacterium]